MVNQRGWGKKNGLSRRGGAPQRRGRRLPLLQSGALYSQAMTSSVPERVAMFFYNSNLKFPDGRKYNFGYSVFSVIVQFKPGQFRISLSPSSLSLWRVASMFRGLAWPHDFGDGEIPAPWFLGISSP